jgi:hypothetical protein
MSDEIAATPSNFAAQLAAADAADSGAPPDMGDAGGAPDAPGGRASASDDYLERRERRRPAPEHEEVAPEPELVEEAPEPEPDYDSDEPPPPDDEATEQEQQTDGPSVEQLMEMHQAISGSHLPEQLFDRMIRVSDGEREWDVPIGEMRQGYMRANNFSRGKQEQARVIGEAKGMVEGIRGQFQAWKQSPEQGVQQMRGILGDAAFDKMVELRATQMYQLKNMPPQFRQMYIENEQLKIEKARIAAEQEQRQRAGDPVQQQMLLQQSQQFVSQHVPALLERHKISMNNASINMLSQHVQALWDRNPATIHQALEEAASATAQELRANAEAYYEQVSAQNTGRQGAQRLKQAVQQQPTLSPRAIPGAAPRASMRGQRGTRSGGGSATDFASFRKAINGGR